jgi:hypothetical protein
MLGKCLWRHKRRTFFYSYHSLSSDAQMKKMEKAVTLSHQLPMLTQIRPYSVSLEINQQKVAAQYNKDNSA